MVLVSSSFMKRAEVDLSSDISFYSSFFRFVVRIMKLKLALAILVQLDIKSLALSSFWQKRITW